MVLSVSTRKLILRFCANIAIRGAIFLHLISDILSYNLSSKTNYPSREFSWIFSAPPLNTGKKVKGTAVALQAWTGPQCSRRLRPQISWKRHMNVVGCQPYAPAAIIPRIILVLVFTGWVDPKAHETVRCHGKIPGDTGNRSRDLPTCSALPKYRYRTQN